MLPTADSVDSSHAVVIQDEGFKKMRDIPVMICIDVEPREREIDSTLAKNWEGVEETFEFFSNLRPRLEVATGASVNFSWFFRMDPQIKHTYGLSSWVIDRYGDAIKQLELAGDELGLHIHAFRWDGGLHKWITDHGNQEWINHCLHTSFEAYQSAFGYPCLSFRFGDHWMNNETMSLLESLGVKFDLTIEPGKKPTDGVQPEELHTGSWPDYTTTPRWPYQPSRQDFRKHGHAQGRGLWVIPLSTGSGLGRLPRLKQGAMAFGFLQDRYEVCQLNLSIDGPLFQIMMKRLLGLWRKPYLAPVVRTDVCSSSPSRANMEQNLNFMLSHPLVNSFKFVRPAEGIKLLT